ncbi:serine protease FAM111A [Petaurus breviceps papuanus]|uniref:serine protease FAM111A n=1 Tax=Petaurus breviceps papuanus TaxID=3040969 RepID=UPI0036DD7272
MASEVHKCEQVVTEHPTDDTKVEFLITMPQKNKHSEAIYKVYGKPNDSVYATLMRKEAVQNELKKRPKEEMRVSTGGTPKIYMNLGMPLKSLPKDSHLHITFVKSEKGQNNEVRYSQSIDKECFTFYILGEGRKKKKIVKSNSGAKSDDYLCVYGINGETIYEAMCNDDRFLSWVTENKWTLVEGRVKYDNDEPVKNVADKKFEVIVNENKTKNLPKGQEQKGKEMTLQQNSNSEQQKDDLDTAQKGAQSTNVDGKFLKPDMAKGASEPILSGSKPKESKLCFFEQLILKIYNFFTEENNWIRNFFEIEVENAGIRGKKLFNLYMEQFGKVTENAMTSKSFKTLAPLVDSIGYIHLSKNENYTCGTCFVFWDRYILTCRHVLEGIIDGVDENVWAQTISENSFVTFTDEDPKHSSKIFYIEPWFEVSSISLDYAVLKLKGDEIPKALFKQNQSTELPCNGIIFIIGHPEGKVKKIDICTVISLADREKNCLTTLQDRQKPECNAANCPKNNKEDRCIHMFSMKSLDETGMMNCQDHLTYNTSFFCGSSGSPVLDASGRLVAMHAAGFKYYYQGQKQSVIEYGPSIHSIHNDMKQNHESWYNLLFPYQRDIEMVNADSPPHLISKEDASGAYYNLGDSQFFSD